MIFAASHASATTCRLYIEDETYIDGPCTFLAETDGSFSISAGKNSATAPYFASVTMNRPGVGDAYWNESSEKRHAHSDLGPVTRQGACWVNELAEISAWE